jgi:hypothetical protein
MEPDARRRNSDICPFPETAYRLAGNKGGSGARPPRRRLQGEPFNVSSETAHHPKGKDMPVGDAAEQSHQIGGKDVLRDFPP